MRIIAVANSPLNTFSRYIYQEGDIFVGVDGGAYDIIKRGFPLDIAIGDFDTTNFTEEIKKKAKQFIYYSPIKDQIDLELMIEYIKANYQNPPIIIYNATGGRIDHELINLKLLRKYYDMNIKIVNIDEEVIYITKDQVIKNAGVRFSLIPYENVTIEIVNAKYNLPKTNLSMLDNFTSSNESLENTTIKIYDGGLYFITKVIK